MKNLKNKTKQQKNKLIDTENRLMVARGNRFGGWAKWVRGVKRYKLPVINKSWGCDVHHVTIVNNTGTFKSC